MYCSPVLIGLSRTIYEQKRGPHKRSLFRLCFYDNKKIKVKYSHQLSQPAFLFRIRTAYLPNFPLIFSVNSQIVLVTKFCEKSVVWKGSACLCFSLHQYLGVLWESISLIFTCFQGIVHFNWFLESYLFILVFQLFTSEIMELRLNVKLFILKAWLSQYVKFPV